MEQRSKSKAGDRVVVISCPRNNFELGWRGVVTLVSYSDIEVLVDKESHLQRPEYTYKANALELELVTETPLYKALREI